WPRVYRERTERQENSFKRMIDHGALEINYGRKKIVGPDPPQPRKRAQLHGKKAWKTHGAESASPRKGGKGTRGCPTSTSQTRTTSLSLRRAPRAGGSRLSQTDHHDVSHVFAGECVDGFFGHIVGAPSKQGEFRMCLTHPL